MTDARLAAAVEAAARVFYGDQRIAPAGPGVRMAIEAALAAADAWDREQGYQDPREPGPVPR